MGRTVAGHTRVQGSYRLESRGTLDVPAKRGGRGPEAAKSAGRARPSGGMPGARENPRAKNARNPKISRIQKRAFLGDNFRLRGLFCCCLLTMLPALAATSFDRKG